MTQRYDLCPENASGKLLFMRGSEAQMNMCTLYAYGQTLQGLANVSSCDEITNEKLLECGEITYYANSDVKDTN